MSVSIAACSRCETHANVTTNPIYDAKAKLTHHEVERIVSDCNDKSISIRVDDTALSVIEFITVTNSMPAFKGQFGGFPT